MLSLPGAAAAFPALVVIARALRPKPRRRGYGCYSEGAPCWVHEQYPYVWAVGLGATVVAAALLVPVLVAYARRHKERTTPAT